MRKLWCAGAIASGLLLMGAAPAQADELPNPSIIDGPMSALGTALEPTNGWRLSSPVASDPLSGQPLMTLEPGGGRQLLQVQPGADSHLTGAVAGQPQGRTEKPADRRRLLPAADVVSRTVPNAADQPRGMLGGLPIQGVPMPFAGQDVKLANVPVDGTVDHTLFSGLNPAGLPAGTRTPAADERPVSRAERRAIDFPLLDGDGTVDDLQRRVVDFRSDIAGLPLGGSPVRVNPPRSGKPASAASATPIDPADPTVASTPQDVAAEDPRLHEEPVED